MSYLHHAASLFLFEAVQDPPRDFAYTSGIEAKHAGLEPGLGDPDPFHVEMQLMALFDIVHVESLRVAAADKSVDQGILELGSTRHCVVFRKRRVVLYQSIFDRLECEDVIVFRVGFVFAALKISLVIVSTHYLAVDRPIGIILPKAVVLLCSVISNTLLR